MKKAFYAALVHLPLPAIVYIATLIIFLSFLAPSNFVFAQCGTQGNPPCSGGGTSIKLPNPIGIDDIATFIQKILEIVMLIGIPIAVFFIIYAGFLFVTARGNSTKLAQARTALLAAVIGTAILLGAWVIATAIKGTIDNLRS